MTKTIEYPDFYELVNNRFSCRKYTNAPVSRETLMAIMETARIAPSACNLQPWRFVIVTQPESRQWVIDSYDRNWIKTAPAFIVALGNHGDAWHRESDGFDATLVDVSIACEHICLAAASLDLGSCWVCNFNAEILSKGLSIPSDWTPVAIIPIGYRMPGCDAADKKRKTMEEIVRWEKFGE